MCARVDVRAPVQMLPAFALRYCPPVRRYGDSNVHVFIHIRIQINYVHNLHPMTHAWGVFLGGGSRALDVLAVAASLFLSNTLATG